MSKQKSGLSRRNFTKLSTTGLGAIPLFSVDTLLRHTGSPNTNNIEVYLFSKHLQFLNYDNMAEATAEMGFDGLDLTVRSKGHVFPERVGDDLPMAIGAIKKFRLTPKMMTTNIIDATDTTSLHVLETAANLGITHYRTGWLSYPEHRTIQESQAIYGQQFKSLELTNQKLGLIGCYQNHAGNHVGAPIWDLAHLLAATENRHFGCQYDIRHAVVEGGSSWELGLRLIRPFIKSIVIKDFKWGKVNGEWKPVNTPLGKGMVGFERYFSLLKKYNINVPISLHLEYDLGGAEHGASKIDIDQKEVFKQMKTDLAFLKETWEKAH